MLQSVDIGILDAILQARNIICDFDGVIADSEEFQLQIWNELLNERALPTRHLSIQAIAGIADRQAIESACPGYSNDLYSELVAEKKARCTQRADSISLVPGIQSFIKSVQGRKNLFICSSSPKIMIDRFLTEKLPEIEFKSILGRGEYPLPKPDPAPYLKMVESAGILEAESVAIEDSSAGVRSATAAGIPVIQLDRYGAATEGVPSVRHAAQLVKWENLK